MAEQWRAGLRMRLAAVAAGAVACSGHVWGPLAPMQMIGLGVLLWLIGRCAEHRYRALALAVYFGLGFVGPQLAVLRLPVAITVALLAWSLLIWTAFVAGFSLPGVRALGAGVIGPACLFVVADYLNFRLLPMWGTAQSLGRPWSSYPQAIAFTSLTGITGVVLVVLVLAGIMARLVEVSRLRVRMHLLALGAGVVGVVVVADAWVLHADRMASERSLTAGVVGWTSDDVAMRGAVETETGFEVLAGRPIDEAARAGARLIVLPEMAVASFEGIDGLAVRRFQDRAAAQGVWLVVGYLDTRANRNCLAVIAPDGHVEGVYQKLHLTPFEAWERGDGGPLSFEVDGVRVGVMICQDDNFTDISRRYGRLPVDVLAVPTLDWPQVKDAHLQNSLHRGLEGRAALVRGAIGGVSMISDAPGRILCEIDGAQGGSGWTVAEVGAAGRVMPFARWGHWPVGVAVAVVAGAVIAAVPARRRKSS